MIKFAKFLGTGLVLVLFALLAYSAYQGFTENAGSAGVVGGSFALIDDNGRLATDRQFRGRWMIVYFGYTHCPDACPTALNNIADTLDLLGSERVKVAPIFVTIDPARDTAKVLKEYLSSFSNDIIGLTGSDTAIMAAEQAYHVYAVKHAEPSGDYEMDHSSLVYIMDPQGSFVTNFTDETDPKTIAAKMKDLMG
jgi:protein SCO1/2